MELPGIGQVGQEWDLRENVDNHLGNVSFEGKRVLEVGPASGFLTFHMEERGAEVVSIDLSPQHCWDIVPMEQIDTAGLTLEYKERIRQLNNGFWLAHSLKKSRSKVVYRPVYEIPEEIGPVDVATFCDVLVHMREPFTALQKALRLTREKVVVTDLDAELLMRRTDCTASLVMRRFWNRLMGRPVPGLDIPPSMVFLPDHKTGNHPTDWWIMSPEIIQRMIGVLGFEKTTVTFHRQKDARGRAIRRFTVVGERTRGSVVGQSD